MLRAGWLSKEVIDMPSCSRVDVPCAHALGAGGGEGSAFRNMRVHAHVTMPARPIAAITTPVSGHTAETCPSPLWRRRRRRVLQSTTMMSLGQRWAGEGKVLLTRR